jgi:hypothetical protein
MKKLLRVHARWTSTGAIGILCTVALAACGASTQVAASSPTTVSGQPVATVKNPNPPYVPPSGVPRADKTPPAVRLTIPPGPIAYPRGIIEARQAPELGIAVSNLWAGSVNGKETRVFAGSVAAPVHEPTATGELLVLVFDNYPTGGPQLPGKTYANPKVPGPFRIVTANGLLLTVAGSNGATFVFDVGRGAIVG